MRGEGRGTWSAVETKNVLYKADTRLHGAKHGYEVVWNERFIEVDKDRTHDHQWKSHGPSKDRV